MLQRRAILAAIAAVLMTGLVRTLMIAWARFSGELTARSPIERFHDDVGLIVFVLLCATLVVLGTQPRKTWTLFGRIKDLWMGVDLRTPK